MADTERNAASDHPDLEVAYRRALERVQHDLFAVLQHHEPTAGARCLAHALLEVTSEALRMILVAHPRARPDFALHLEQMLEAVRATGEPPH